MDRIHTLTRLARVPPLRTPVRRPRLRWRILHPVPTVRVLTAPLERVQQPKPVAHLVRRRPPEVIPLHLALRHRRRENHAPVVVEVLGALGDVLLRVGRVAEVPALDVGDVVDVEVTVGAVAEGALHSRVVGVAAPGGADGVGCAAVVEGHAGGGVVRVEDVELLL